MDEVEIVEWVAEVHSLNSRQCRHDHLTHGGARVHREDDLRVASPHELRDDVADLLHRLAVALSPMQGEKDPP